MNFTDPGPSKLPSLPIINPGPPRPEYAGEVRLLLTVGIAGLVIVRGPGGMVRLPSVDACATSGPASTSCTIGTSPTEKRLQAAYRLSRDPAWNKASCGI